MKYFRSKRIFGIAIIAVIVCSAVLALLRSYITVNPFKRMELSDIADFDVSNDGYLYVLNDSGTKLIRVDSSGKVNFVLAGNSNAKFLFKRGLQVTDDADGNIYIHNRIPSDIMSSAIGEENVVIFSSIGVYKGTYLDSVYEEPLFRPRIIELQNVGGHVYAIIANDTEVIFEDILTQEKHSYQFPEANLYISAAAYNDSDHCMYVVSRDGRILRSVLKDDNTQRTLTGVDSTLQVGDFSVIYEIDDGDEKTIPADITVDDTGRIFVADIGKDSACEIVHGQVCSAQKLDIKPIKITSTHLNGTAVAESSDAIAYLSDKEAISIDSLSNSVIVIILSGFTMILLLAVVISMLYILIYLLIRVFVNSSEKIRSIGTYAVFAMALTTLFCMMMKNGTNENTINNEIDEEIHNAVLIDMMIDSDDFVKLRDCRDFDSKEYERIRDICENVILQQGNRVSNRYAILYTLEEDDAVYARYSTEQNYGCNYPYIWTDGTDERELYDSGEIMTFDEYASDPTGNFLDIYAPLTDDNGEVVGVIEVGCDYDELLSANNSLVFKIGLSLFVLMVVVLMILLELIEYIDARKNAAIVDRNRDRKRPSLKMLRMAVFIVFFITNLATPFLPIYALELAQRYNGFLSLSSEVLAAIPISAEVLLGAIFSILGNKFIEKWNIRKSAFAGGFMFVGGLIIRCLYPDLWVLTAGNGIMGAGWGILLLIINSTIASEEDQDKQEEGFTNYNIALQNGLNTGIIAGGFALVFVDHLGVLIAAAILSFNMLIFVSRYMFDKPVEQGVKAESSGIRDIVKFIFSPKVLLYFICIVVPVLAASYYLNFLYPIIGANLGMSETNIGYSFLLYGLVTIVLSNVIMRFVTAKFSDRTALFLSSLIYFVTFVLIGVLTSVPMLIAALILLPASDSFGYVIQETYYSRLKETEKLGYEKAMGVYSLFENLSQTIGSFVFGYILSVGVTEGMIVFGITIGICGLIFLIGSGVGVKRDKEN